MKIYFGCSIRAGRSHVNIYSELIAYLQKYGTVLSEHFGDKSLTTKGTQGSEQIIHNQDLEWLLSSDVTIFEVTTPSLGVGYEIGRAVEHKKKVLCLYRPQEGKSLSAMIRGCSALILCEYDQLEEAKKGIDYFFSSK